MCRMEHRLQLDHPRSIKLSAYLIQKSQLILWLNSDASRQKCWTGSHKNVGGQRTASKDMRREIESRKGRRKGADRYLHADGDK